MLARVTVKTYPRYCIYNLSLFIHSCPDKPEVFTKDFNNSQHEEHTLLIYTICFVFFKICRNSGIKTYLYVMNALDTNSDTALQDLICLLIMCNYTFITCLEFKRNVL